jgi:hypothetical protein
VAGNRAQVQNRGAVVDVHSTLENLGRLVVERAVEPALGARNLWDKGLGDVVSNIIGQCNLPKHFSALEVGQALGLVKNNPVRRGR